MLVAPRSLIKSAALKEEVLESYEMKMDCLNRAATKCVICSTSKIITKVPEVELSRAVQRGDETVVFR